MLPELAMAGKARVTAEKCDGDGGKSVRHCLEFRKDSKEGVGRFSMSRNSLEPSTDSKEGVGHFSMSRHS